MNASSWVLVLNVSTGKVLLGQRSRKSNNPGQWNFFGGGVEDEEKAKRTAQRELREEFGLKTKKGNLVKIGSLNDAKRKKKLNYYLLALSFKPTKDHINKKEIAKAKWFAFDELPNNLHAPTKMFFKSNLFELIKAQVAEVQANRAQTKAALETLAHLYKDVGIKRPAHEVLAELPEGVSLAQVMEVFEPVAENYRNAIDQLRNELAWCYTQLDNGYQDYVEDLTAGIDSYRGAILALDTYTPEWFAELPVSYERLTEIAGLLASALIRYIRSDDIPAHMQQLIDGDYSMITERRGLESADEPDVDEDEDDEDE